MTRIGLASSAWRADALPLNYIRIMVSTPRFEQGSEPSKGPRLTKLATRRDLWQSARELNSFLLRDKQAS